jgi:hypothetical protein
LAGSLVVRGDEDGPLAVRLEPYGVAVGRLVDADGKPVAGRRFPINSLLRQKPEELGTLPWSPQFQFLQTDKDGKFRIEGLVPGMKYDLSILDPLAPGVRFGIDIGRALSVKSGEVKDLGDIPLKPQ